MPKMKRFTPFDETILIANPIDICHPWWTTFTFIKVMYIGSFPDSTNTFHIFSETFFLLLTHLYAFSMFMHFPLFHTIFAVLLTSCFILSISIVSQTPCRHSLFVLLTPSCHKSSTTRCHNSSTTRCHNPSKALEHVLGSWSTIKCFNLWSAKLNLYCQTSLCSTANHSYFTNGIFTDWNDNSCWVHRSLYFTSL